MWFLSFQQESVFLAVLRNMAFETVAFRKEIRIFKGVEALIKVGCDVNA